MKKEYTKEELERLKNILTIDGWLELQELEKTYLLFEERCGDGSMSEQEIKDTFFNPIEKVLKENSKRNTGLQEISGKLGQYCEVIEKLKEDNKILFSFIKENDLEEEFNDYFRNYIKDKLELKEEEVDDERRS